MEANKVTVKRRSGLGRGLSALLEDSDQQEQQPQRQTAEADLDLPAVSNTLREIPAEQIETNPYQPRTHFEREALEELAESIKVHGIIQPITVRQLSRDRFQLISGERRWQASRLAGLALLPAYIRTADDKQMLEMALIENIQRENLNALEVALSYRRLITECNLKQEELGERVGKKRSTVNNYLRLLRLPPEIQAAVRDNRLSMGHARSLVNVENVEDQLFIYNQILSKDLSVRKAEELVRQFTPGNEDKPAPRPNPAADNGFMNPELKNVQNKLATHFGTRVLVKATGESTGEIRIPYLSDEDLNRILDIISV
ncbi:MAG: ParB/RepB/Spo0J family partition protein [Bacteroidota bacterium]